MMMGLAGLPERTEADQSAVLVEPTSRSAIVSDWSGTGSILFGAPGVLNYGDPPVTIPAGSFFAGFGGIQGNVYVHGKTEPGYVSFGDGTNWIWGSRNPIGKLTVTGTYTLENDGTLVIDVTSPSRHDLLRVDGTAYLGGTLRIDSLGYQPKLGDRIPILRADRMVGRFLIIKTNLPNRFRYDFKKVGKTGYFVVKSGSPRGR